MRKREEMIINDGKGNTMTLDIGVNDIEFYYSGAAVEEAFPYLTNEQQEFIDNGYFPEDWDKNIA